MAIAAGLIVLGAAHAQVPEDAPLDNLVLKVRGQWQAGDARAVLATLDQIESLLLQQTEATLFLRAQAHDELGETETADQLYKDYLAAFGAEGRYSQYILARVVAGEIDLGDDFPRSLPIESGSTGPARVRLPRRVFSEQEAAVRDWMVNGPVGQVAAVNLEWRFIHVQIDTPAFALLQPLQVMSGDKVITLGPVRRVGPHEYTIALPVGAQIDIGSIVYNCCNPVR